MLQIRDGVNVAKLKFRNQIGDLAAKRTDRVWSEIDQIAKTPKILTVIGQFALPPGKLASVANGNLILTMVLLFPIPVVPIWRCALSLLKCRLQSTKFFLQFRGRSGPFFAMVINHTAQICSRRS